MPAPCIRDGGQAFVEVGMCQRDITWRPIFSLSVGCVLAPVRLRYHFGVSLHPSCVSVACSQTGVAVDV
eukprot:UN3341